jgi:hypothetical protein
VWQVLSEEPVKVRVAVNGEELPAKVEYQGRLKLRLNDLVVELNFKPSTVEVDLRGFSLDPRNISLLLNMAKPALSLIESKPFKNIVLKIYGITVKLQKNS